MNTPPKPFLAEPSAFIPLSIPDVTGNERAYLNVCIDSGFVSSVGPFVEQFEANISTVMNDQHVFACASGTCGLHLALITVGVGPDDIVIIPDYSFIATANAVSHSGATPWFIDVDLTTLNLDAELLKTAIEKDTDIKDGQLYHCETGKRVAAIMPVYTLGNTAGTQAVIDIAKTHNIPVIADAAAGIGTKLLDVTAHVFSFNGNKSITSGGGGAVVSRDADFIAHAKHIGTTARSGSGYTHDAVAYNYRMTNVEAAIGCAQIERLNDILSAKKAIQTRYIEALSDCEELTFLDVTHSTCWLSCMLIKPEYADSIVPLLTAFKTAGIGAQQFWFPLSDQKPYIDAPQNLNGTARDIADRLIVLPCSVTLTPVQQDKVIDCIRATLMA